jgi:hypothetical protein
MTNKQNKKVVQIQLTQLNLYSEDTTDRLKSYLAKKIIMRNSNIGVTRVRQMVIRILKNKLFNYHKC